MRMEVRRLRMVTMRNVHKSLSTVLIVYCPVQLLADAHLLYRATIVSSLKCRGFSFFLINASASVKSLTACMHLSRLKLSTPVISFTSSPVLECNAAHTNHSQHLYQGESLLLHQRVCKTLLHAPALQPFRIDVLANQRCIHQSPLMAQQHRCEVS